VAEFVKFGGNLIPALVWLLAHSFFVDSARVPKLFFFVCFIYLSFMLVPDKIQATLISQPDPRLWLFFFFPQLIKMSLVLHVIYLSLRGRSADLMEKRLRLRGPVALIFALIVVIVIAIEIAFSDQVPMLVQTLGGMFLFLFVFLVTAWGMRVRPELAAIVEIGAQAGSMIKIVSTVSDASPNSQKASNEEANQVIRKIAGLMDTQRFYANYDVTLDVMSQRLNLPTYKLRGIINQEMGFRNFNQFLNSYRIAEAGQRLINDRRLPILSIALDIGFKSLSAFNKAFRDTHHMTPTAYRVQHLNRTD
jgi:AraC-like DNA-binding protein